MGPELIAVNLRCKLDRNRWLKIVDALEEEFNQRLRVAKMRATQFKAGDNPVARLFGKELLLLVWAIEDADPSLIPNAIQNWRGLVPEERWWLYDDCCADRTLREAQCRMAKSDPLRPD